MRNTLTASRRHCCKVVLDVFWLKAAIMSPHRCFARQNLASPCILCMAPGVAVQFPPRVSWGHRKKGVGLCVQSVCLKHPMMPYLGCYLVTLSTNSFFNCFAGCLVNTLSVESHSMQAQHVLLKRNWNQCIFL